MVLAFDLRSRVQGTKSRIIMGGPPQWVARDSIRQGIPVFTGAEAHLASVFDAWTGVLELDDASDFRLGSGAFSITGPQGSNWFTYEVIEDDVAFSVRRLSGKDDSFPVGSVVRQWQEVTSQVTRISGQFQQQGAGITFSLDITGAKWDSTIQFQDATVLVLQEFYIGSTQERTEWLPVFMGYLDPVAVNRKLAGTTYTVTARCEKKYLEGLSVVEKEYGNETVPMEWTADSELDNPDAEPNEGDGVNPFTAPMVGDKRQETTWISKTTPTRSAELASRPSEAVMIGALRTTRTGYGLKIQSAYFAAIETLGMTRQQQIIIELWNSNPTPSGWPWEDDVSAGIKAEKNPEQEGGEVFLNISVWNARGQCFFPQSKNGVGYEPLKIPRETGVLMVYDKRVFDSTFVAPPNYQVIEFRQCDGWNNGLDPRRVYRGKGAEWWLDPYGDGLILRGSSPANTRWNENINDFDAMWIDAVYWGDATPPSDFPVSFDETVFNQNSTGMQVEAVWGNRGSLVDGYLWDNISAPGETVKGTRPAGNGRPAGGIADGASIRRGYVMGGGRWRDDPTDPMDRSFGVPMGHDSATKHDWVECTPPIFGNPAPDATYAWLHGTASEHGPAYVIEDYTDNTWTDDIQSVLVVGPGEAAEFEPSLLPGDYLRTANGVAFTYRRREHDRFYGVTILSIGTSQTFTAGEEITLVTNRKPTTNTGGSPIMQPGRLYAARALKLDRYGVTPTTIVVGKEESGYWRLQVPPGSAARFPYGGQIEFTYSRETANGAQIEYVRCVYTYRTESEFGGVTEVFPTFGDYLELTPGVMTRIGSIADIPLGSTIRLVDVDIDVPEDFWVLISRKDEPNDPLTYIGSNPDWDLIPASQFNQYNSTGLIPLTIGGVSSYIKHIRIVIRKMKKGGRAKINTATVFRTARKLSGMYAPDSMNGAYRISDVAAEILDYCGYGVDRRVCSGGPEIESQRIDAGNAWEALVQLAEIGGMVVIDGPLGTVQFVPDRRMPGASYPTTPKYTINLESMTNLDTKELDNHSVNQLEVTGSNNAIGGTWTVVIPPSPYKLGNKKRVDLRVVYDERNLRDLAQALLQDANGGVEISLNVGHVADIGPQDIIRLVAPIDLAGQFFNMDFMVTGFSWEADHRGRVGVLKARDFRSA